ARGVAHVAGSRRGGRRRGARRRHRRRDGPGLERRAHERHRSAAASLLTRSGVAVPLSYNVRNLLVRRWTSAFTAGGIALVVAATMLLSALVTGLKQMLVSAGESDNV